MRIIVDSPAYFKHSHEKTSRESTFNFHCTCLHLCTCAAPAVSPLRLWEWRRSPGRDATLLFSLPLSPACHQVQTGQVMPTPNISLVFCFVYFLMRAEHLPVGSFTIVEIRFHYNDSVAVGFYGAQDIFVLLQSVPVSRELKPNQTKKKTWIKSETSMT